MLFIIAEQIVTIHDLMKRTLPIIHLSHVMTRYYIKCKQYLLYYYCAAIAWDHASLGERERKRERERERKRLNEQTHKQKYKIIERNKRTKRDKLTNEPTNQNNWKKQTNEQTNRTNQPANQQTNQPTNQPTSQPNQPTKPTNQPNRQTNKQTNKQPTDERTNERTNESINQRNCLNCINWSICCILWRASCSILQVFNMTGKGELWHTKEVFNSLGSYQFHDQRIYKLRRHDRTLNKTFDLLLPRSA